MDIAQYTKTLYKKYGQSKAMDGQEFNVARFFLQRNFKGEQDLLMIFFTLPCCSNCMFCNLCNNSNGAILPLVEQYIHVITEMKHSLSVLDRVTLSNNGSILDRYVVDPEKLLEIIHAITTIRNITVIVVETELAFVHEANISTIKQRMGSSVRLNILTGFETFDNRIRAEVLGKKGNLKEFEKKLDIISGTNCELTTYILYKPEQSMTNIQARDEAYKSAEYVLDECKKRGIPVTLRVNPMFAASGTEWARKAQRTQGYSPPRLSEVFTFAKELNRRVPTYVGLSTEGKSEEWGSYRSNDDFTSQLLLAVVKFNTMNSEQYNNGYNNI